MKLEQVMKTEILKAQRIEFCAQAIPNWLCDKTDSRTLAQVLEESENEYDSRPAPFVILDGKRVEFYTDKIHGIDVRATLTPDRASYGLFLEEGWKQITDTEEIPSGASLFAIPSAHR